MVPALDTEDKQSGLHPPTFFFYAKCTLTFPSYLRSKGYTSFDA